MVVETLPRFRRQHSTRPKKDYPLYGTPHYLKPPTTLPPSHILTNPQVCSLYVFLHILHNTTTPPSPSHNPSSLCTAQHLHLLWHGSDRHESFPARHSLWSRNHSSLQRAEEGRARTTSVCHCGRCTYAHADRQPWADYHCFRRKWCW